MTLVDMNTVLRKAYKEQYAVIAANLISKEMIKAGIKTAEKLKSPLIMQIAPVQFLGSPLELVGPMMVAAAKKANVPVVVHLDHGETIEQVKQAIELGFTSVMIDASQEEFYNNIKKTKEVVAYAKQFGVTVESELGSVGAEGQRMNDAQTIDNMTKVELAKEFVDTTGCDALAVAIGNAHGPYVDEPNLDFDRLQKINEELRIPLVLHGGSGISEDDFKRAINLGITKVNIATLIHNAVGNVIKNDKEGNYFKAVDMMEAAVCEVIEEQIRIFGSEGTYEK